MHNVKLLASILDGKIVPPGGTFSFNEYVGQRTPERGFKEGYAIVGGLFLPSIGGGVCQAATTVYDTAFYAGLPSSSGRTTRSTSRTTRWAWTRRSTGPAPTCKFKNDTDYGILIKAWADAATMTVSFYSTPNGRKVEKIGGRASSSFTEPGERYILKKGLRRRHEGEDGRGRAGLLGHRQPRRAQQERQGPRPRRLHVASTTPEDTIYRVGPEHARSTATDREPARGPRPPAAHLT